MTRLQSIGRRARIVSDERLASLIAARWSPRGHRLIRPASLVFRKAQPIAGRGQRREPCRQAMHRAAATNLHVHLAWNAPTFQTSVFQALLLRPAAVAAIVGHAPDADRKNGSRDEHRGLHTRHTLHSALSFRRTVRTGSDAARATVQVPGSAWVGTAPASLPFVPFVLSAPLATRNQAERSASRQATAGLAGVSTGPRLWNVTRRAGTGATDWIGRPELRRRGAIRTVPVSQRPAPALTIRSVSPRHITRTIVVGSAPRIVGWHSTKVERQAPSVSLERPPATASVAQVAGPRAQPTATIEFAKPDAKALARTVSEAVRGVADAWRSETKPSVTTPTAPQIDVGRLTRQVYDQLERELRIDKERRGL